MERTDTFKCRDCGQPGVELSADAWTRLSQSNAVLASRRQPQVSPAEVAVCSRCYRRRRMAPTDNAPVIRMADFKRPVNKALRDLEDDE